METEDDIEHWQKVLNQVLTTLAGSLSICGTIIIFVTFALWEDIRTTSRKILVFISIGDLITAMVSVSGISIDWTGKNWEPFCKVQSFLNITGILISFFWTVYLSIFLYLFIRGLPRETERKIMFVFHVTAWGIPLIVAISAASVGNVFGHNVISNGWCWISQKDLSSHGHLLLFWMFFAGKGWEILAYIAIPIFYIKAKIVLKRKMHANSSTPILTTESLLAARKADRKFSMIPLIFIMLRMWGTLRFFFYIACFPECQNSGPTNLDPKVDFWLKVFHGIGDSSQGFANFLIFCLFTDKIRCKIKLWCCRVCPWVTTRIAGNNYNSTNATTLDDCRPFVNGTISQ
ncbi:G-protein coupled receptor 157-like [Exaiptasia diaphana]|uniref:G-protein coupled receptors family 2 profile 2 domain-containing protein n=1 Tax=Exaiptasia diaphana TaxID=2652724 RepID=A0A913XVM0_EXADI|nr:G-protein coupled receptor 157-like [Exaiptasia diaphana]